MNRRIIWGVLLLITFLTFYLWMPAGMYQSMPVFLGIIGGALCFIFMAQTFANFTDMDEITEWDRHPKQWYHNMAFVCIPVGIVLSIVFAMHYTKLENEELRQFGIRVPATIVDGYSRTGKSSTHKLTVSFYTKEGKHVRTQKEVGSNQYALAGKGQHIEVIYSQKHPGLVKILLGDEEIEELTGIKSRKMTIKDLTQMLEMPEDSILPALNRISYRWTMSDDDSSSYINELKKSYFSVDPHVRVTCVVMGDNMRAMMQDVSNAGFKKETSDTTQQEKGDGAMTLYTKGDLKMVVQTKAIEPETDPEDRTAALKRAFGMELALVVTMFRN